MNSYECVIYGLGYIGLPTAVYLASKDIKVYGLDVDKKLVENRNEEKKRECTQKGKFKKK